jgi:hypothetical protein
MLDDAPSASRVTVAPQSAERVRMRKRTKESWIPISTVFPECEIPRFSSERDALKIAFRLHELLGVS